MVKGRLWHAYLPYLLSETINRIPSDIICRELVKETLDSTTNNYKKLANIAFKRETRKCITITPNMISG